MENLELRLLSKRAVMNVSLLRSTIDLTKGFMSDYLQRRRLFLIKMKFKAGKRYPLKKSMNYAFQGIISFNDRPLRICIQFGFVSMALFLLYIVYEFCKFIPFLPTIQVAISNDNSSHYLV